MAKIKLGNRPKNFKQAVSFTMLDGMTGTIECVFKYRTRIEFGAFLDSVFADAGETSDKFAMADLMEKTRNKNAEYLSQVLDGWNLDEELSLENLQQLADECPGAVHAVMESYRAAILDGRLGN